VQTYIKHQKRLQIATLLYQGYSKQLINNHFFCRHSKTKHAYTRRRKNQMTVTTKPRHYRGYGTVYFSGADTTKALLISQNNGEHQDVKKSSDALLESPAPFLRHKDLPALIFVCREKSAVRSQHATTFNEPGSIALKS